MTKEEAKKEISRKLGEIKSLFEQAVGHDVDAGAYEEAKASVDCATESYRDENFDQVDAG